MSQRERASFEVCGIRPVAVVLMAMLSGVACPATVLELHPAQTGQQEEFEDAANSLKPGDELVLHGGTYSQTGRRAVTVRGTADRPIIIRAAQGESPLLTHPEGNTDRQNNIEFIDCGYLIVRGLTFKGGSSGVRFIRGHHVTFEDCEIRETGNNALTMNSGDCDAFIIRRNHIHHTGLSDAGPTEGEGMYIGCHDGSCATTNTLIEGNYIHHTRGTSDGGNDGIEIKFRSGGNIVRDNVIHDTVLGRHYPGVFVYGGGTQRNIVEGNAIWNAGEGIQVVSDAVIRNNIIFDCLANGITAAPHAAVREMQSVTIVNNTIVGHPTGVRIRWSNARDMVFSNNAVYCPEQTAVDASGIDRQTLSANYVCGVLHGCAIEELRFHDGGTPAVTFFAPAEHDYRLRPDCPLVGRADPAFTAEDDFNHTRRTPPFDVGAYEIEAGLRNPGWHVVPGFKRF
jgi:hypothetical protein